MEEEERNLEMIGRDSADYRIGLFRQDVFNEDCDIGVVARNLDNEEELWDRRYLWGLYPVVSGLLRRWKRRGKNGAHVVVVAARYLHLLLIEVYLFVVESGLGTRGGAEEERVDEFLSLMEEYAGRMEVILERVRLNELDGVDLDRLLIKFRAGLESSVAEKFEDLYRCGYDGAVDDILEKMIGFEGAERGEERGDSS